VAFYIALPFIIRIIDGQLWRAAALTGFTILFAEAWSVYVKLNHPWNFFDDCHPFVQAPAFLCGVTASLIAQRVNLIKAPNLALLCLGGAILALPFLHVPGLLPHIPFAILVATTAALSAAFPPWLLASRIMQRIGEVSYSMYLVHFAFLVTSLRLAYFCFPASDWRTMVAHLLFTVMLTFPVACITFKYIEQPPIRWMARYLTARRTTPAQALNPPQLASR
jgi:peptidoglycan/LPS O-acetylase OafA/YrhL